MNEKNLLCLYFELVYTDEFMEIWRSVASPWVGSRPVLDGIPFGLGVNTAQSIP